MVCLVSGSNFPPRDCSKTPWLPVPHAGDDETIRSFSQGEIGLIAASSLSEIATRQSPGTFITRRKRGLHAHHAINQQKTLHSRTSDTHTVTFSHTLTTFQPFWEKPQHDFCKYMDANVLCRSTTACGRFAWLRREAISGRIVCSSFETSSLSAREMSHPEKALPTDCNCLFEEEMKLLRAAAYSCPKKSACRAVHHATMRPECEIWKLLASPHIPTSPRLFPSKHILPVEGQQKKQARTPRWGPPRSGRRQSKHL